MEVQPKDISCSHFGSISSVQVFVGMSLPTRDVEEVHKFLRVHAAACSEEEHQEVRQAQCSQLVAKLQSAAIGVTQATCILEEVDHGPWLADQKQLLRSAVATVAMTKEASTSAKTQVLFHPDQYMTASMWKHLETSAYSEQSKLHSYCLYLNQMGLGISSEQTAKHCTAKFLVHRSRG